MLSAYCYVGLRWLVTYFAISLMTAITVLFAHRHALERLVIRGVLAPFVLVHSSTGGIIIHTQA